MLQSPLTSNRSSLLLLVSLVAMATAAPILPDGPHLTDEMMSLAGLSRFRVRIRPITPEVAQMTRLSDQVIAEQWKTKLRRAGFEVADGTDTGDPLIELQMQGGSDTGVPDGFSFSATIELLQKVRIERLDRELMVPTYSYAMSGLETSQNLRDSARRVTERLLATFVRQCKTATAAWERERGD